MRPDPGPQRPAAWTAALLGVLVATVFAYLPGLPGGWVFDDANIRDNGLLHARSLDDLARVLTARFPDPWTGEVGSRRLGYATFAINHLFAGLDPVPYRITNLAIHLAAGLLVYWLLRTALCLAAARDGGPRLAASAHRRVAFVAAALWLLHPVQIQAVTYVVQRLESLASLLMLAALALYAAGRRRAPGWPWFLGCAVAGLLALGVKQKAAMLPVLILIYELCFLQAQPWQALRRYWWVAAVVAGALAAAALLFLGSNPWAAIQAGYAERDFGLAERLLTEARVLWHYLSLIALPLPSRLNLDYQFPLSTGLLSPPSTGLALAGCLALLGTGAAMLRRQPLLAFALLWFLACLALESSVIPLELVYEHRLYLASLGPIAAAAVYCDRVLGRRRPVAVMALGLAAAATLGSWTWERNQVWADPVRLWTDTAAKSPGKARVQVNLGDALSAAGRHAGAAAAYRRAIALDPEHYQAHTNLAVLYMDRLDRPGEAEALLREVLAMGVEQPKVYTNLAVVQFRSGRYGRGYANVMRALARDPAHHDALDLELWFHTVTKDYGRALQTARRALALWPNSYRLHLRAARLHAARGATRAARDAADRAWRLRPQDPDVRRFRARLGAGGR